MRRTRHKPKASLSSLEQNLDNANLISPMPLIIVPKAQYTFLSNHYNRIFSSFSVSIVVQLQRNPKESAYEAQEIFVKIDEAHDLAHDILNLGTAKGKKATDDFVRDKLSNDIIYFLTLLHDQINTCKRTPGEQKQLISASRALQLHDKIRGALERISHLQLNVERQSQACGTATIAIL